MKTNKSSTLNEEFNNDNKTSSHDTKKQSRLANRKRIEDYLAEKKLREYINDLDFGY
ncbi:MAG: PA3496 family putative envelope integrity protein [Gammaproteobacteria bacterium]